MSKQNIIVQEPYNFRLEKIEGDKFKFEVTVGSSAMYELTFILNEEEINLFNELGNLYIKDLARKVQKSPSKFLDRSIQRQKEHSSYNLNRECFYLEEATHYKYDPELPVKESLHENIKLLIAAYSAEIPLHILDNYLERIIKKDYDSIHWELKHIGDYYLAISLISIYYLRNENPKWEKISDIIPFRQDRVMSFIASNSLELDYSKFILNFDPYIYLHNYIVDLHRVNANVESFLTFFYPAFKGIPWHDSHINNKKEFFGYWSFALAAIVKKLEINDSAFMDHMYYPRDLLNKTLLPTWEDSERGEKARLLKAEILKENSNSKKNNDEKIKEIISESFKTQFEQAISASNHEVFSEAFSRKISALNWQDNKNEHINLASLHTLLTELGRELQNIKINTEDIHDIFMDENLNRILLENLAEELSFSKDELLNLIDDTVNNKNTWKYINEQIDSYENLGKTLVEWGKKHSYKDEIYWDKIDELLKKYGVIKSLDFKAIRDEISTGLKEKFNKSPFKLDISLDDFLK